MLDGKPYPTVLGKAKVQKLCADAFSECSVSAKVVEAIATAIGNKGIVRCNLIIKK